MPLLSICIPAYNRADRLPDLLDSILGQEGDYDIVVCEDRSPEREAIRERIRPYVARHPERVRYFENEANLGYDGNLRRLVEQATGTYCLFMGNDDLMAPGGLAAVQNALREHPGAGVVVRSYAAFSADPARPDQVFRYFPERMCLPAGPEAAVTAYRRSVVIPGMVIHREAALRYASPHFDGTLLYQLHLVANIALDMDVVFVPEIITLYRTGGVPDFGNSEAERGRFVPERQTPESSLHFIQGLIDIARVTGETRGAPIFRPILRDLGNYSYPLLSIQAHLGRMAFLRYARGVGRMGLWRNKMFWAYLAALLVIGPGACERMIVWIKGRLGHTPRIGKLKAGAAG